MTALQPPAWRQKVVQFDVSHNAIALAFFAFTAMLQAIITRLDIIRLPTAIHTFFFILSTIILLICSFLTFLRTTIFPPSLLSDFQHARLSNFFYLPVIIGGLALLSSPNSIRSLVAFRVGFYILGSYQVLLALYFFGEWLFASAPTRSIYPLYFMQTIGFFLLSIVASTARLPEPAFFMLSVGILFWFLIFVTNFQHVSHVLGKQTERPQPAFFLFIAPPAQAAIAFVMLDAAEATTQTEGLLNAAGPLPWSRSAEWFLFVDLFIYLLMLRLFPTWWNETFKFTWWAYVFPLCGATTAVVLRYESVGGIWGGIAVVLAILGSIAMILVLCLTIWSAAKGHIPKNEACILAYEQYYRLRHGGEQDRDLEEGVEAVEGDEQLTTVDVPVEEDVAR